MSENQALDVQSYEQLSVKDKVLSILDFCSPLSGQEFLDEAGRSGALVGDLRISSYKITTALIPLLNKKIFAPAGRSKWPSSAVTVATEVAKLIQDVETHAATGGA